MCYSDPESSLQYETERLDYNGFYNSNDYNESISIQWVTPGDDRMLFWMYVATW